MSSPEQSTTAEDRILALESPHWYNREQRRVCLQQLRSLEPSTQSGVLRQEALIEDTLWYGEDYDESEHGVRPEGIDLKADVSVCGIGGCTLRILQSLEGSDITSGECKAIDYCLKEKFEAVGEAPSVEEGRALYRDLLDTCHTVLNASFCPNLTCELAAGVSEDTIPGTDGRCAGPLQP